MSTKVKIFFNEKNKNMFLILSIYLGKVNSEMYLNWTCKAVDIALFTSF